MADSLSSIPWYTIFAFLVPTIAMVVQMHYPDSSPADKHPLKMWIFIVCLLLYCFAWAYYFKCQISTSTTDTPYFKLSSHMAVVSGTMACAVLISVLVPDFLVPLLIIIYLIFLLMYFVPSRVMQTCKNIGSYCSTCGKELKAMMTHQSELKFKVFSSWLSFCLWYP